MLKVIQGLINFTTPLICCILEIIALTEVAYQNDSICIQAREISAEAQIFISLIGMLIVPDLIFCLMTVLDFESIVRPSGPWYHVIAAVISLCASIFLFSGITYCGNVAQDKFLLAVILSAIAGIVHFFYIFIVLMQMPEISKWSISSPFNK